MKEWDLDQLAGIARDLNAAQQQTSPSVMIIASMAATIMNGFIQGEACLLSKGVSPIKHELRVRDAVTLACEIYIQAKEQLAADG